MNITRELEREREDEEFIFFLFTYCGRSLLNFTMFFQDFRIFQ